MGVVVRMFSEHQHLVEEFLCPLCAVLRGITDQARGGHHAMVQPRGHAADAATVGRVVAGAVIAAQPFVQVGRPSGHTGRCASGHASDRDHARIDPARGQQRDGAVLAECRSRIDRREWRRPRGGQRFEVRGAAGPRLAHPTLHLTLGGVFESERAVRRPSKHRPGQHAVSVHFDDRADLGDGSGPRRPWFKVHQIRHHHRSFLSEPEKSWLPMTVPRHVQDVADAEFLGAMCHVGGPFEQESVVAVGSVRVALIDALVDHQRKAEALRDGAGNVEGRVLVQAQRGTHPMDDEAC